MYCKNCGKEIDDKAEICVGCGVRVSPPIKEDIGFTKKLGNAGIPGFRSGKKWKMVIAIFGYFWILMILLAAISGPPDNQEQSKKTTSTVPAINVQTDQEQTEAVNYRCVDGSMKDNLEDCPPIPNVTQPQPDIIDIRATINSASDERRYIHNPTLTLTNAGASTVDNMVFDVEIYLGGKLITSETNVLYLSGGSSIESIPAGESTKGYLNLMIYERNTNGFTRGTYLLRVIVRKGTYANPIAVAEKTIEIAP